MSMTRKDYVQVAKILNSHVRFTETKDNREEILEIALDFCDFFQSDNPNFSRERFIDAVGGN